MVKIIFLIACLASALVGPTTSTDIECSYNDGPALGSQYICHVLNEITIITEESAQINGINGTHKNSKCSDDVDGFYASSKTMQVFPKGLDKFFKNLKMINVNVCQLKEIHQSDLKVFPNLISLTFHGNKIEVIEEGLLDFNPNLYHVEFEETQIIHIDPNVFDNLNKLLVFRFSVVPCVGRYVEGSRDQVLDAIKVVKQKCSNLEFLEFDDEINNLEIESKTLNFEEFSVKLESFEESFNNSKFSQFRPLNYKFQNLKASIKHPLPVNNDLKNINDQLKDLKDSQCGLKGPVDNIRDSQIDLLAALSGIKTANELNFEQFGLIQTGIDSKINEIQKSQNSFIDSTLATQESILSLLDAHGSTLESLKASHDELSMTLDELKSNFADFMNQETQNGRQIDEVKKEFELFRFVLSMSIDAKLKALESNLMEKIDKIIKSLYIL